LDAISTEELSELEKWLYEVLPQPAASTRTEPATELWTEVGDMETLGQPHILQTPWNSSFNSSELMTSQPMNCSLTRGASINSLRHPQKNCGQFNNDYTDAASALVASVANNTMTTDAVPTISQAELLTLIGEGTTSLLDGTEAVDSLNHALNFDLEDHEAFLDEFINLENILNEGNVSMEMDVDTIAEIPSTVTEGPIETGGATSVPGRKRRVNTTAGPSIPVDHMGYAAPSKRIRHSSAVSTISETDSEVSSTTLMEVSPTEKYIQRRIKNNIASKRSRESRKQKFVSLDQQAVELERNNAKLRLKITELEELAKEMKEALIQRMVAK